MFRMNSRIIFGQGFTKLFSKTPNDSHHIKADQYKWVLLLPFRNSWNTGITLYIDLVCYNKVIKKEEKSKKKKTLSNV